MKTLISQDLTQMPYLPLADSCPSVLSKSTLIVEVMLPEFVLKASKARLLTLGDLAKALKKVTIVGWN